MTLDEPIQRDMITYEWMPTLCGRHSQLHAINCSCIKMGHCEIYITLDNCELIYWRLLFHLI